MQVRPLQLTRIAMKHGELLGRYGVFGGCILSVAWVVVDDVLYIAHACPHPGRAPNVRPAR